MDTERLLRILTMALPRPRVIFDRVGGRPYLSRWYLLGEQPVMDDRPEMADHTIGNRRRGVLSMFLHCFHRSDDDGALHSHPWKWAIAIVLAGGYREQVRKGDEVVERLCRPGAINFIRSDDYHRVTLLGRESWSLFITGPKVSTWYFWDPETKLRAPWRAFVEWRRGLGPSPWEPEG